ncbi:MAG TPA: cation:proton antiporter, partial [Candidatus Thermoplasmatota archaeon]|nr:cation:proton antiporter [Candidatus Thermoplasmatota archaeon]
MAEGASVFLMDLAVVMGVAAIATVVFHRFRQPVVLGYLLAGLVVGPYTPPFAFVHDIETIEILGELGVVFLLFALGLEFNFRKLRRVGVAAILSGAAQAAIMVWLGYVVGILVGFTPLEALFLGAVISISSTVIIVKVVAAFGQQEEEWAQLVFGILIVEDVVAVILLTLISAGAAAGGFTAVALGVVLGKLLLFLAAALVLGLWIVPWLVGYVARQGVPEVLVVTVLGLAFGLAVLGGLLGFSAALGGFIMGALIAESDALHQVEELIHPIRDMFTAIFFVAIGMLVDPRLLLENWAIILVVSLVVVVGKILAGSMATFFAGYDHHTALRVGFGLAQIGEFSFVIAALVVATYGGLSAPLFAIAVSVTAITSFTTPLLIRVAPRAVAVFDRRAPQPLLTFLSLYSGWWQR